MPREFHLYNQPDGGCALQFGDEPVRHFADLLEAVDHIRTQKVSDDDTLIIYDVLGNVTLRGPL